MRVRANLPCRYQFGAVLLAAMVFRSVDAHCPGSPPIVQMEYPEEGVSIQNACYPGGNCFTDTFYREKLLQELQLRFQASRHAVLAYVDSVSNYQSYDSIFYRGQLYYIDTVQTEKVWISVHTDLKDSLPVRQLTFVDSWIALTGDPYATTYTPLIDTPFVAMFSDYDNIRQLGVGPMDGCFFEPTAFTLFGGRIRKKGQVGERMPGVSVAWEDLSGKLGLPPVALPPVREKHVGLAQGRAARAETRKGNDRNQSGVQGYDMLGRWKTGTGRIRLWPWTGRRTGHGTEKSGPE